MWAVKESPPLMDGRWSFFMIRTESTQRSFDFILAHPSLDVNAIDKQGDTALIRALGLGNKQGEEAYIWGFGRGYEAKRLLAHSNINPNLADKKGRTPLLWAKEQGQEEIAKLILSHSKFIPNTKSSLSAIPCHIVIGAPSHLSIPKTFDAPHTSPSHRTEGGDVSAEPRMSYATFRATSKFPPTFHPSRSHDRELLNPSNHGSTSHAQTQTSPSNIDFTQLSSHLTHAADLQPLPTALHPESHLPQTDIQSSHSSSPSSLEAPDHDLQQTRAHLRQLTSTPMSARAAEKRPAYDFDDEASARSFRRRLG
ncbi:hypothetical protein BKA70DRAFT_1271694 [Coprinopsis sp. MPI-PUGE-AT-0042]|nr:hypothetical protein BKA70DRAFT_1271694 [Coprinopsis sp. MPI-PUGE-AT-0042]